PAVRPQGYRPGRAGVQVPEYNGASVALALTAPVENLHSLEQVECGAELVVAVHRRSFGIAAVFGWFAIRRAIAIFQVAAEVRLGEERLAVEFGQPGGFHLDIGGDALGLD